MKETVNLNRKEMTNLDKFATCQTNNLQKPLNEKAWQAGKYPLVECLSKEECHMRVERKGNRLCAPQYGASSNNQSYCTPTVICPVTSFGGT